MNILNRYTLYSLKKNRTRTLVTVIGIILSVAMFTAVTEAAYSGQQYLVNGVIASTGRYEASIENLTSQKLKSLIKEDNIKTLSSMQSIGYAECGSLNEYKPYLYIAGVDDVVLQDVAVNLQSGRMPENAGEIVLPRHLSQNGGKYYNIGDTVTLNVGNRSFNDEILLQNISLQAGEELIGLHQKSYTVVGICSRPNMEDWWAPGYTAYTLKDETEQDLYTAFVTVNDSELFWNADMDWLNTYGDFCSINMDLLMFQWRFTGDSIMSVVIGLGSILCAIIFVGSVSLIYNSFSISVSERTRQFGILRSVGATKKQLIHSVLFEGFILCLIGIPFGLFFGCLGLDITFRCLEQEFATMFNSFAQTQEQTLFRLVPNTAALLIAAVIAMLTVLVSALIPAKRAMKISPMQALRLSEDISVKGKDVKDSKIFSRLFGFEGTLARKNFMRNRKKYRTTVISLVLSLVLFISASSLTFFFNKAFAMRTQTDVYDIMATSAVTKSDTELYDLLTQLGSTQGVTRYAIITEDAGNTYNYVTRSSLLSQEHQSKSGTQVQNDLADVYPTFTFVQDEAFDALCKENGFNKDDYYQTDSPKAILYDCRVEIIGLENGEADRIYIHALNRDTVKDTLFLERIKTPDEAWAYVGLSEDGKKAVFCEEADCYSEETEENPHYEIPLEECAEEINVVIGDSLGNEKPYFILNSFCLIYPLSQLSYVMPEGVRLYDQTGFYCVENHGVMFNKMQEIIKESGLSVAIQDMSDGSESIRAFIKLLSVFSYGFIALISLIAGANVFNTVSTNISLRRRELAMLKSVGLSQRGLNRMMRFESFLYGFKALSIGLPCSLLIAVGIYSVVKSSGFEIGFSLPWGSIVLGVFVVLAVVAVGMAYSVNKLKKYNTADELKNENL